MSLLSDLIEGRVLDESGHWVKTLRVNNFEHGRIVSQIRLVDHLAREFTEDNVGMPILESDKADVATTNLAGRLLPNVMGATSPADRESVLSALAARCLGRVRDLRKGLPRDDEKTARRFSALWRSLRDRQLMAEPKVPIWDKPRPLAAGYGSAAEEAEALLTEIRVSSRRQCGVYFPTTGDAQVIALRLTKLEPAGEGAAAPTAIRLAPWSAFTLEESNWRLLEKVIPLRLLLRNDGRTGPFLLELYPVLSDYVQRGKDPGEVKDGNLLPPRTLVVTDDSLSLAVCLAAWALNNGVNLRRMCVTGKVCDDGDIAAVGIGDKLTALIQQFGQAKQRLLFLMPEYSNPGRYTGQCPENIIINGRKEHREVFPRCLNDLVRPRNQRDSDSRPDILTDCFDDYRAKVIDWPAPDEVALERAKALFDDPTETQLIVLEKFNGVPVEVAATVARALVECIAKKEPSEPGFAAEHPTPLILPLEECPDTEQDYEAGLVKALEVGVSDWRLGFTLDAFFHNLLTDVVRSESDKLWLVVYCRASLDMMPFGDLQKRVERLKHCLKNRAGHLVFVASNYHHYLMLHKHLKLEPPAFGGPAADSPR